MTISFVGAGPGAADLLTMRAVDRLGNADIVLWAGSLVSADVLDHCGGEVELMDTKSMTLEDVTEVFADNPEASIVRLHSGDPAWYSAIGEQIAWCIDNGRDFEIVPGVSSVSAAAAAFGAELTVPGISQTVILGRLARRTARSAGPGDDIAALAAHGAVLALFLSAGDPDALESQLLAAGSAYGPDTPALIAHRVSWPDEALIRTTVSGIASALTGHGITMSALVLVGDALAPAAPPQRSHVYDPAFSTSFREGQPSR